MVRGCSRADCRGRLGRLGLLKRRISGQPPPPSSTSKKPGHTKSPTTPSTTPKSATALGASSLYPVALSFSDAEHGLLLLQGCSASLCTSSFDVTIDGGKNWKPRTAFLTYPATASTHVQGVDAVVF